MAGATTLTFYGKRALRETCLAHMPRRKILARDDRRRPQDHDDLKEMLARAGASERGRAELAVDLIARRGFSRGKDLVGELRALIAERPRGG